MSKGIHLLFIIGFICLFQYFGKQDLHAQENGFYALISNDTVLLGNNMEVKFFVKNETGRFEPPEFDGLRIVGGPNTSSSIQMINGEISQKSNYSFFLKPEDIGTYVIKEGYFHTEDGVLETQPIILVVLPNPDGIVQDPNPIDESNPELILPDTLKNPAIIKYKSKRKKI